MNDECSESSDERNERRSLEWYKKHFDKADTECIELRRDKQLLEIAVLKLTKDYTRLYEDFKAQQGFLFDEQIRCADLTKENKELKEEVAYHRGIRPSGIVAEDLPTGGRSVENEQ